MYALLSPAKRLNFDNVRGSLPKTESVLKDKTTTIAETLKQKSADEIGALMSLSDKLAALNYERFQKFGAGETNHAIFAFDGDTYTGLDAKTLSDDDLKYAQDHVGMLSGLYGVLRPFDLIHPYRLEMGTKLSIDGAKDLYDFWGDQITQAVNKQIEKAGAKAVVNLASNEYIKAIQKNILQAPFLDIDFKEMKNGKPKTIGIHAKKARGMMARYIVQNRIEDPKGLKRFDWVGYAFRPELSSDNSFVFVR